MAASSGRHTRCSQSMLRFALHAMAGYHLLNGMLCAFCQGTYCFMHWTPDLIRYNQGHDLLYDTLAAGCSCTATFACLG
jgi:hypothetical protein